MQQLFKEYIRKLDSKFERQGRKVLMLVDNCAACGHVKDLKAVQMDFLPPNTTSLLQSMDRGIIRTLKHVYRSRVLNRTVLCVDSGKSYNADLMSAFSMLSDAWKTVTREHNPELLPPCVLHGPT